MKKSQYADHFTHYLIDILHSERHIETFSIDYNTEWGISSLFWEVGRIITLITPGIGLDQLVPPIIVLFSMFCVFFINACSRINMQNCFVIETGETIQSNKNIF